MKKNNLRKWKAPQKVQTTVILPDGCSNKLYHIYTDGSMRPEDNAACAYLVFSEKSQHVVEMARYAYRGRTNNQMELEAVHKALDLPYTDYVIFYTDSEYVISCLTLWHKSWAKNDWITPDQRPVKNRELIQSILNKMATKKFVRFQWVKAHAGDKFNSVVDFLAQDLTSKMREDRTIQDGRYFGLI